MTGHPVIDRRTCLYTEAWPDPVIPEKKIRGPHRPWKYLHANARRKRMINRPRRRDEESAAPSPTSARRTDVANRGHRRRHRHPCRRCRSGPFCPWEEEARKGKIEAEAKQRADASWRCYCSSFFVFVSVVRRWIWTPRGPLPFRPYLPTWMGVQAYCRMQILISDCSCLTSKLILSILKYFSCYVSHLNFNYFNL